MNRILKFTLWFLLTAVCFAIGTGVAFWYMWSSNLPYIGSLREYKPPIISEIYGADGRVIGRFWEEKRIVIPLEEMPDHLIKAFVAAEDSRFFEHEGVDLMGIVRAFFKNLAAGKIEQGGSTITQQVTRSLLLKNTERTYRRKAREVLLSMQIEKEFSKERILYLYLNQIYLGEGAYGVEAAARTYFGKSAKDLDLSESAMLAGLPQAPSRYSPVQHFDRAKARQRYVLQRMLEEGYITQQAFQEAVATSLRFASEKENTFQRAPYFTEQVRRTVLDDYGHDLLYRGGIKVYTSLDLVRQEAAEKALAKGLAELDKREGYRGPLRHIAEEDVAAFKAEESETLARSPAEIGRTVEAVVEEVNDFEGFVQLSIGDKTARLPLSGMKWARRPDPDVAYYRARVKSPSEVLKRGDVVLVRLLGEAAPPFAWEAALEQNPSVQGAVLSMIPETGEVNAMVGGRDFTGSQFNRATQSRRQPGSAFKPIIYAAALDWGMSPASIIIDAPYISDEKDKEEVWKPKNYKERFFGPTLFRTALAKSMNVITVKILKKIGVEYAIDYARKMGFESHLSPDLSLALGSSGVSLVEAGSAYAVFANGGNLVKPLFIKRIEDRSGNIIEENQPQVRQVISKETAYVMTDMLKAVVQEGTGWRAKALKRPAAGKTGTTNDLRDAWFIGYTPGLVAGVWVGYDDQKPMGKGETGSRAACPIWLYYMSEALKDRPVQDFPVPEDIVFAKIDAKTGLLAGPYSEKTIFQAFTESNEPKEYSPPPESAKSGQFSQFDLNN